MKLSKTMRRVLNSNGETTAVKTAERLQEMGVIKITARYVERARLGIGSLAHRRERIIVQFKIINPPNNSL